MPRRPSPLLCTRQSHSDIWAGVPETGCSRVPNATDDAAMHDALPNHGSALRGSRFPPCGDWAQCSSVHAIVCGRRVSQTPVGHRNQPYRTLRRRPEGERRCARPRTRLWIIGIAIDFVM